MFSFTLLLICSYLLIIIDNRFNNGKENSSQNILDQKATESVVGSSLKCDMNHAVAYLLNALDLLGMTKECFAKTSASLSCSIKYASSVFEFRTPGLASNSDTGSSNIIQLIQQLNLLTRSHSIDKGSPRTQYSGVDKVEYMCLLKLCYVYLSLKEPVMALDALQCLLKLMISNGEILSHSIR